MSDDSKLANIQDIVWENQRNDEALPDEKKKKLVADENGKIIVADDVASAGKKTTEIEQSPFESSDTQRQADDWGYARKSMPNAERKSFNGKNGGEVNGILYAFRCERNNPYTMFAWYNGASYQVKVLEPRDIENHWKSAHSGHLFSDSRICFGANFGGGQPTLPKAYSKSALWASGFSVALETGVFPWNFDQ